MMTIALGSRCRSQMLTNGHCETEKGIQGFLTMIKILRGGTDRLASAEVNLVISPALDKAIIPHRFPELPVVLGAVVSRSNRRNPLHREMGLQVTNAIDFLAIPLGLWSKQSSELAVFGGPIAFPWELLVTD